MMKLMLDGYALGYAQGTGLATYACELANALISHGHEVSALYGINGVRKDSVLKWPGFVQTLVNRGQPNVTEYRKWVPHAALYALRRMAGLPPIPQVLQRADGVDLPASHAYLKDFSAVCNLPSLYNACFAFAALCRHALEVVPPSQLGIEIFHRTSPVPLRMRGVCNVVTAHDVIPLTLPCSTTINLDHYRRILQRSLDGSDRIFVVSEYSRQDLARVLGIPLERMIVTYQSVTVPEEVRSGSADDLAEQLRQEFGLEYGRYFLFYGAIEPKKNVMRLLDAQMRTRCGLPLLIVGRDGWLCDEELSRIASIRSKPEGAQRLQRLAYLPRQTLMRLLRGARALVFPSLYEGFGLPPLEAMAMGVPVITSNRTAMPEVCADAAMYVDPLDPGDIAVAMDRLANDDALCASLIQRGRVRALEFSPERHIERIERAYRMALGDGV